MFTDRLPKVLSILGGVFEVNMTKVGLGLVGVKIILYRSYKFNNLYGHMKLGKICE